jgi:four helix bundle protein
MGQTVTRFEDLSVWQKAQDLSCNIYKIFHGVKDYAFKDQICRASVSISSNIAEGFDRRTSKEYLRFLEIARTSANEVKSLLYLSSRLNFISQEEKETFLNDCEIIIRMLVGLMKAIEQKINP